MLVVVLGAVVVGLVGYVHTYWVVVFGLVCWRRDPFCSGHGGQEGFLERRVLWTGEARVRGVRK